MAATPLTLMDAGLASSTLTTDSNTTTAATTLDTKSSNNTIATSPSSAAAAATATRAASSTSASSAIRPTMLFGSIERLDTSANMLVSPNGSSGGNSAATSPSFLPEMPQWKKDLIQRRKSNVARTIGAAGGVLVSPTTATMQQQQQQQRLSLTCGQLLSPTAATTNAVYFL
ncbi:uncharacterized protein LOC110118440 [Ceratitis capitata]|uniref:uncharacterized protein LOC110118440 n=1 Tax=Ceratitis capitata TaxID=7213 RepID=UPI000A10D157|nr:uncharacterized protein LOC110118440 [Ceratitis capitata]